RRARSRGLSAQERRMAAPVVRDVDIVTQDRTSTTPATTEAAVNATTGAALGTVTVLDDPAVTGADLSDELAAVGPNSLVILNGTFATTAASTLQDGQTLMGGGGTLDVRGASSGATATFAAPGGAGTIDGDIDGGWTLAMAANSTIAGLTVINETGDTFNGAI